MAKDNRSTGKEEQQTTVPNGLVDAERLKQLETEAALARQREDEISQLKAQLAEAQTKAASVGDVQHNVNVMLTEMRQELDKSRRMQGELQVALDKARTAAGLNTQPVATISDKDFVKVPLQRRADGSEVPPVPGSIKKQFRVSLAHCGTKIVELWEPPGGGFASREAAVKAFNQYMGVITSDHTHEVQEVTGPEALIAEAEIAQRPMSTLDPFNKDNMKAIMTGEIRDPGSNVLSSLMAEMAG